MLRRFLFVLLGAAVLLSACTSQKDLVMFNTDPKVYDGADTLGTFSLQVPEPYKVKVDDQLLIKVMDAQASSAASFNKSIEGESGNIDLEKAYFSPSNYVIESDGMIDLPLIGRIGVEGYTIEQIQDTLDAKLEASQLMRSPKTIVRLTNFRVTVMGEVTQPGVIQITQDRVTIVQALGLAGDLTDYANIHRVKLIREIEKGVLKTEILDLGDPKTLGSPFFYLQPGDILYVEPAKSKSLVVTGQSTSFILSSVSFVIVLASTVLQLVNLSQNNTTGTTPDDSNNPD
ncbi:MAG: polysaccharide biosynthesis/export family protein [Bacteroidota bacterium]